MYLQFHCETRFVSWHVLLVRTSVYCFFVTFFICSGGNTVLSIAPVCPRERWILKLAWKEEIGCLLLSTQISWMLGCEVNIEQKCMLCMCVYVYVARIVQKYMLLRSIL